MSQEVRPTFNLTAVVLRLADRRQGRTEANVQGDLHLLLRLADFNLDEGDIRDDVVLEAQAGQGRRIDVEVGLSVFEVKRDLRGGKIRENAVSQLAGYVRSRTNDLGQRYVGILTDGAEWHLYHLRGDALALISSFEVNLANPDAEALVVWLEGVLSTAEGIKPTPREIERRLGSKSPAFAVDIAELEDLYRAHGDQPSVKLKRELWAKLLTTAFGVNFDDEDELFIEHTLLVATAELIGHAIAEWNITDRTISPAEFLSGALFTKSQIGGVVEGDFFDWVVEVPGGDRWVRALARRLARFAWEAVEHDVMKVLYESVISAEQRKKLGEYYTPDWLASEIVDEVVTDPLTQRVLDPACGSGTFIFHAVRRYLAAADAEGLSIDDSIAGVCSHVIGVDVHPVAVTLARVTYLLAIGRERLNDDDRPKFTVPVYLGDSVQWGQQRTILTAEALTIPTADGAQIFGDLLKFPDRVLVDAGQFDRLVTELADRAARRPVGSAPPKLSATFSKFSVQTEDQDTLNKTFTTMCTLHDEGRDHIWGYFVRNLARPTWLGRRDNRVDVLVGNPPWLVYRHMTPGMKQMFRAFATERKLWAGAAVATHQDLSGLFVSRAVELYLRVGGRFGFVMPYAVLSRRQFAGFRTGEWPVKIDPATVAFDDVWDLHRVKPSFFPVPAAVVFGTRTDAHPSSLDQLVPEQWAGRLKVLPASNEQAAASIRRTRPLAGMPAAAEPSPYGAQFSQGAIFVPRMLLVVEPATKGSPLGTGANRRAVRSRRTKLEKPPWKAIPGLEGSIEKKFIRPVHVGDTILAFRALEPFLAVVPWDGALLHGGDDRIDLYDGFASWWRRAERVWMQNRSANSKLSLIQQVDFRGKLSKQFPTPQHRVVYTKGGMYLAAARIDDPEAVIDHKLYWASVGSIDEARFLTAILNSTVLGTAVRPLQARGEHNPRDFDKYVWTLPIPLYDLTDPLHDRLVELATRAEDVAAAVVLPPGIRFEAWRRRIREALVTDGVAADLDEAVGHLLTDA